MQRIFERPYLIAFAALFGMYFLFPNGLEARFQRGINFEIILLAAMAVYIFVKFNKAIGIFLLYVAGSFYLQPAVDMPIRAISLAMAGWFLWICSSPGQWENQENVIYDWICIGIIVNTVWQLLQWQGVWWLLLPSSSAYQYTGLMTNTNETSTLIAVCLPAFFRRKRYWFLPFPLIGFYLAISIGGIVAAALVGLIYLAINYRRIGYWLTIAILIMGFVVGILLFQHKGFDKIAYSVTERAGYFSGIMPVVNHRVFGWGLGQYKYVVPLVKNSHLMIESTQKKFYANIGHKKDAVKIYNEVYRTRERSEHDVWLEAHNDYLEAWFCFGIVGLALFLFALFDSLRIGFKQDSIAFYGFLISAVSALWFFTWQTIPIAIVSVLYLGLIIGRDSKKKEVLT